MKTTSYRCDRCGAELGEHTGALERKRFVTVEWVHYSLRFFSDWKGHDREFPTTYDLCHDCRESLERWLNNGQNA